MKKFMVLTVVALLLVGVAMDAFAGDVEKALFHDLSECSRIVKRIAGGSTSGAPNAIDVALLKKSAEVIRADRLLLAERQDALSKRAASQGGRAVDRQDAVSSVLLKNLDDLLGRLDAIGATLTPSDLDSLKQLLDILVPHKPRPLLGALPYRHTNYPSREPAISPLIKPAYKGGDRSVSVADTATTHEAPRSKEVVELAQSLQWNPVLIYEWVKNNVETEWYWGSMKGAEETLRQKSGNDADQATLLVALLRASGFPSRYIKGTIEFFPGLDNAKNLIGLDDPAKIHTFLQKAGIPVKAVIAGGTIANFQIEHIWVESFIPYSNYRGAVIDDQGKIWLGLDTSIKPQGFTRTQGAGVPADMLSTLRDDYLNAVQTQSPLDYLKGKLDDSLVATQPVKNWSSLKDGATLIPDVQKIIPSGLQFPQIAITGEYQTLPDELKHKLSFSATANNNELFSITLETLKLSNRSVALRAEPETVEDQNLIDSFGGLDNTPAYLVKLRPVLTIDGERITVAQDGLPMGGDYTLNIDVITPNGTERISSSQINGNLSVIGVVSQKAITPAAIAETDNAEAILHKEAIGYIDRWNRDEVDLAALLGQSASRPAVTIATVGAQLDVTRLMDSPHDMQWKGLFLDAGYKRIETVGRNGSERDFMRLSALQGSILENRIFEDNLKVDSVSTAKLMQLAAASGTALVTLDKTNIDTILPSLPFDADVKQDITNAVNQGLTVSIPQSEVSYQDWSGVGYVKENLETGESGWMLSGQVAGGMTAWSGERWDNATLTALYDTLSNTSGIKPNKTPLEATYIFKIPATDQQIGVVGKLLGKKLQVKVLDSKMRPVYGAPVTFSVKAGGGSLSSKGVSKGLTFVATSNFSGVASVTLTLGEITANNPIYWSTSGSTYSDQYGDNVVEALLENNRTSTNFNEYGAPGPLSRLRPAHGMTMQGFFLSYAGFVSLMAEDIYGNPIANQEVTFKLGQTTVTGNCKGKDYDLTPALLVKGGDDCLNTLPTISDAASCKNAAATIMDTTSISGAWAGVILGGAPGATYPVTATVIASNKTYTAQFAPSTFDLVNCNVNVDPKAQLVVSSLIPCDIYGNSINAARSGSKITVSAKQYLIKEGEAIGTENLSCIIGTLPCSMVVGNHTFATISNKTDFIDSTVKLDGVSANNLGNGLFQWIYTLKPGLNNISIEGSATYGFNHASNSCSGCGVIGKEARTLGNATAIQVYGVEIAVKQPLNIMLDGFGVSRNNLKISYTINPADYRAMNALILLYKVTEINGQKTYDQIDYIPVERQGAGFGVMVRGYRFDETQKYAVRVALNYGSYVQIMSDPAPITFAKGVLIPDYNHNRKIEDDDFDRAMNSDPYYFWVNDDDGKDDTEGSGIPGSGNLNWNRTNVNGTRDLVDFFPVYLDIAKMKSAYPPSVFIYKLHNETSSLSIVETPLNPDTSGSYLTDVPTAILLAKAPKAMITADGYTLPDRVLNGKGVILLEGWKESTKPLKLVVYDVVGKKMDEIQMNLSIDGVEQMFRHMNLIPTIDNPNAPAIETGEIGEHKAKGGEKSRTGAPLNLPDSESDEKYVVMLHGFKNDGQVARGWHSEMFKRLYWSGSRARFVGVSWYGFEDIPNYQQNAVNAFMTAAQFGQNIVKATGNAPVTILAHSLGNMVASSYLSDYHQTLPAEQRPNIVNYFMLNAAVALEAYLGDYKQYTEGKQNEPFDASNEMVHTDWYGYHKRLGASEWYRLFVGTEDERRKLTWRNRFAEMPTSINYYSFYSTGEDVLGTHTGVAGLIEAVRNALLNEGLFAWAFQEKWKGRAPLFNGLGGTTTMGWGFNLTDALYNPIGSPDTTTMYGNLNEATANSTVSDVMIKNRPFFNISIPVGVPTTLFDEGFNADLQQNFALARLLGRAIPALTTPAGGWKGKDIQLNDQICTYVDMNDPVNKNGWPSNRENEMWHHSDIMVISYIYVNNVFNKIVNGGGLK